MSDHYYSPTPLSRSNPTTTHFTFAGHGLTFETDHGVFSKGGMDKGTEILLKNLPQLSGSLLDLGCGWGAIGVSLGKAYPALAITMVDVNQRAVALAQKNALINKVGATLVQGDGFCALSPGNVFDTIVTNPPIRAGKEVIYSWFKTSIDYLSAQGKLYIVIRKQQGAPSALTYLSGLFAKVTILKKESGYWILCCEKQ